ncbi:ribonuclease E inhibitor RraB [Ferrimonas lipolytica]|uniref:Ribonuclease E inhibitor RraB n=1 Tax=Ferrimonas lipolytica TaxID=2724191 RepID=A0A6H1UIY4_9GAMM|nr:ribonuclease E inhibitor RraB [Ferrimonas lipolytica]QIZ78589.1 ribonuclease E inhibitor RraB [Ferrimonas lipolytica]
MSFPNDANGELLELMQDEGIDLSESYMLDFYVVFASEEQAQAGAERVGREFDGAGLFVNFSDEAQMWELRLQTEMVPEHAKITAIEELLNKLCKQFKGKTDGWGMLEPEDEMEDDLDD